MNDTVMSKFESQTRIDKRKKTDQRGTGGYLTRRSYIITRLISVDEEREHVTVAQPTAKSKKRLSLMIKANNSTLGEVRSAFP